MLSPGTRTTSQRTSLDRNESRPCSTSDSCSLLMKTLDSGLGGSLGLVDLSGRLGKVATGGGSGVGAGAGAGSDGSCWWPGSSCGTGARSCWAWALCASRCLLLPIRGSLRLSLPPPPSSPFAPASLASLGCGLLLRRYDLLRESLPSRPDPILDSSLTVEPQQTQRSKEAEGRRGYSVHTSFYDQ